MNYVGSLAPLTRFRVVGEINRNEFIKIHPTEFRLHRRINSEDSENRSIFELMEINAIGIDGKMCAFRKDVEVEIIA